MPMQSPCAHIVKGYCLFTEIDVLFDTEKSIRFGFFLVIL